MSQLIDVGVDFETFYDGEYSLRKMENAQYVMDGRFEVMGVSIKLPGQPTQWYTGDFQYIKKVLSAIPWHQVRMVAHNARFDASILEWRFGFKAAAYLCTMVGSRPHIVPKTGSASLASISAHLKLKAKGNYVEKMAGKHRTDMTVTEMRDYGVYCCDDTDNAVGIAEYLVEVLPQDEQQLIDLTIKKYLRPRLRLDGKKLIERYHQVDVERKEMLARIETKYKVTADVLKSRDKFAKLLESKGIVVPMKKNIKGKPTFAFAKNDLEFKRLLAHPSQEIRELCDAKMKMSSSLEQARLVRLISLHNTMNGLLPVPLVYYGAHPGRFSGDEKINLQNLPRVDRDKHTKALKKGHLRYCVVAPPGYTVISADYSNIEARIVAALSGQVDLVEAFRLNRDVYSEFATRIYGKPINKIDNPDERFVGKTCILGLGYGMGWEKFMLKMAQEGVIFTPEEARRIVYLYRETYSKIPDLWKGLEQLGGKFLLDKSGLYTWKNITWAHERIILPNGMPIQYPDIASGPNGLFFRSRKRLALDDGETLDPEDGNKIWGGHFTENIAQGLARIISVRDELTLTNMGIPAALQVHDELVFCVPTATVDICKRAIASVMTRPVEWLPNLPIAVEVKHGASYGDAK